MAFKNSCPICNSKSLFKFLERKNVPVHQNLLIPDYKKAITLPRGDLNISACNDCGFVFNQTFDLSKLSYGEKYDNTQDISPYFDTYISELAEELVVKNDIKNATIVEIGCGKGSFLQKLVKEKDWNNTAYGFDPSYNGPNSLLQGRLNFKKKYYDLDCAKIKADVIVCRHVIEHIPDPLNLLRMVRISLENSKNASVYFETPTVDWILENHVIYDFFYEHCSYFSKKSLTTAFEMVGFDVNEVKTIFESQYLWLNAKISKKQNKIKKDPGLTPILAKKFSRMEKKMRDKWNKEVRDICNKGPMAIWGAGAKGVTFCNLLDPNNKLIDCVIDLNPNKQGKFIPGTGHQIIDYKEIPSKKIKTAILMNPNYYSEVEELLKKSNIEINLVNL